LFPLLFIVFLSIAADCRRDDEGKINGNETTEQKTLLLDLLLVLLYLEDWKEII
jgi:hypothetical protein